MLNWLWESDTCKFSLTLPYFYRHYIKYSCDEILLRCRQATSWVSSQRSITCIVFASDSLVQHKSSVNIKNLFCVSLWMFFIVEIKVADYSMIYITIIVTKIAADPLTLLELKWLFCTTHSWNLSAVNCLLTDTLHWWVYKFRRALDIVKIQKNINKCEMHKHLLFPA